MYKYYLTSSYINVEILNQYQKYDKFRNGGVVSKIIL